jgi:hypothetical protein
VHELARWRLIDVLARRNQFDPHADQALVEVGVVAPVACEPVYLVHDQVVGVVAWHLPQHLLQDRAVVGLGRLGPLDVDLDHLRSP